MGAKHGGSIQRMVQKVDDGETSINRELTKVPVVQFNSGPNIHQIQSRGNAAAGTVFPINPHIDERGTVADADINILIPNARHHYVKMTITNANPTIHFLKLFEGLSTMFTLDMTNGAAITSITFDPVLVNPPTLNLGNTERNVLFIIAHRTASETRYEVVQGTSGTSIPDGTIENEHLEWDNTANNWVAVTSNTFGATGPFADNGFLRFANDQIVIAARNAADDGNVEIKIDSSDFVDITESANGAVVVRLRGQDAVEADIASSWTQFGQLVAGAGITNFTFPFVWEVFRGVDQVLRIPNATNVDLFEASDTFGFNLASAATVNMGELNALVFNSFSTVGKSIGRFATGLHYDLENSTHAHIFRVNGGTPLVSLIIDNTNVTLGASGHTVHFIPAVTALADIGTTSLFFSEVFVGTVQYGDPTDIQSITGLPDGLQYSVKLGDEHRFRVNSVAKIQIDTDALFASAGSMDLGKTTQFFANTFTALISLGDSADTETITGLPDGIQYDVLTGDQHRFRINGANEMILNAASLTLFATAGAGHNLIIQGGGTTGYIELDEISTPAPPVADNGILYVKDVATVTTLFFQDNAGTETNLLSGGSGANTALSNLTATAINLSLISDGIGVDDLGSAALPWRDLWMSSDIDITGNEIHSIRAERDQILGNNTTIFEIQIEAQDSIGTSDTNYGEILGIMARDDDGSEQGAWTFGVRDDSIVRIMLSLNEDADNAVKLTPSATLTVEANDFFLRIRNVSESQDPQLVLHMDDASPSANALAARMSFDSEDSASNQQPYASIEVRTAVVTSGSEQGDIHIRVATGTSGALGDAFQAVGGTTGPGNIQIGFRGSTPVSPVTYTVTNPTTDRTFDVAASTLDETRETLGTLLQDLADMGVINVI